jgi:hypothetical protein
MQKKLPSFSDKVEFHLKVHAGKEYRYQLCSFFENILMMQSTWDSESVITACGFLVLIRDFEPVFLSKLF